jgi:hypothetical protein
VNGTVNLTGREPPTPAARRASGDANRVFFGAIDPQWLPPPASRPRASRCAASAASSDRRVVAYAAKGRGR